MTPEGNRDFRAYTNERFNSPYGKIVSNERAISTVRQWHEQGFRVIAMDAVLDIPTFVHANSLRACANLGDRLLVRVNSDEFTASRKDARGPIVSWEKRAMHAANYPYVDLITMKSNNGYGWLEEYKPDILVKNISSGPTVIEEVPQLDEEHLRRTGVTLLIMDEHCSQIVPREEALQRAIDFEQHKYHNGSFTGSLIKSEVKRRAIDDFLRQDTTSAFKQTDVTN